MSLAMKALALALFLAPAAWAAPGDPAEVAVEYLEKLRTGRLNLEPGGDTAISAATGRDKRRQISARLERIADDLHGGTLEAGEVREEAGHAAVMVYRSGTYDPGLVRAVPIALVRGAQGWLPAPLPASFENTGVGRPLPLRDRLRSLEEWMIRQRSLGLEALREKAEASLRGEIRRNFDLEEMRRMPPGTVARKFLDACKTHDLPVLLGYLGGLGESLPADWSERLHAAEAAAKSGPSSPRPWRLLLAPEVLRAVVYEEVTGADALVSICCLDPAGGRRGASMPWVEVLHFELSKDRDGIWRVDLPGEFLFTDEQDHAEIEDDLDVDLLDMFPSSVRRQIPEEACDTVDEAVGALERGLLSPDLTTLAALLDLSGDPLVARLGCARMARAWYSLHEPASPRHPVRLGVEEQESAAVAVYQFFSLRNPDRTDLKSFYFRKTGAGWVLAPGMKPEEADASEEVRAVNDWARDRMTAWTKSWREEMLALVPRVARIGGGIPDESEASQVVERWLQAIAKGDVDRALGCLACLDDERGATRLLRNLGYEINGMRKSGRRAEIVGTYPASSAMGVGVAAGDEESPLFPFYPVVSTPAGPRILLEVDLFASPAESRQRAFLNSAAFNRIRGFADADAITALRGALAAFQSALAELPKASHPEE